MRRMCFTTTAVVVTALMMRAASAGAATPVRQPRAISASALSSVAWRTCPLADLRQAGAQCGYESVPLNYRRPKGTTIKIAVSRIEHTSSDYQGIILSNPGGPGAPGLDLNVFLIDALQAEGFRAAAADYDWIGFDPRGIGHSEPQISCEPDYFGPDRPNYVPGTTALLDYWLSASRSYAQACESHSALQSALLDNMTTPDDAMDMDQIRQALGQSQITFYGFSWGTYLGQVYATLFPSHVRRLILDSNINPTRPPYDTVNLDQDAPFNRNENIWFSWLAKYNRLYHLGSSERSVQQLFYATENQLQAHPIDGIVGPDEWNDIFQQAAYYEETWLELAPLFSNWVNTPSATAGQALVGAYEAADAPGNDNPLAGYLATQCTDAQWSANWRQWSADTWAIYQVAPFLAWSNTWFNGPCVYWPAPAQTQVEINGTAVSSTLLIDETLDAATPFEGSLEVRKLFPTSVLISEPGGTSHADSLFGDLCVDATIAAYLQTGELPRRNPNAEWDKTCAPLPKPVPTSSGNVPAVKSLGQLGGNPRRFGSPAVELK